ncbi:hypothetical protein [Vibrio europaeus]|uniref:hypothetical protein n=1 Tax=Vibrio europaeus TaxID=300876 RepID=UPI00233E98D5|nr:hypothetical protein [Vibrio europaeus]MDC5853290.1 hypothetical protein [Vibrio europaeus]
MALTTDDGKRSGQRIVAVEVKRTLNPRVVDHLTDHLSINRTLLKVFHPEDKRWPVKHRGNGLRADRQRHSEKRHQRGSEREAKA